MVKSINYYTIKSEKKPRANTLPAEEIYLLIS